MRKGLLPKLVQSVIQSVREEGAQVSALQELSQLQKLNNLLRKKLQADLGAQLTDQLQGMHAKQVQLQVVKFRRLKKPKEDQFALDLSKQDNYADVIKKLAYKLKVPDSSIGSLPMTAIGIHPSPIPSSIAQWTRSWTGWLKTTRYPATSTCKLEDLDTVYRKNRERQVLSIRTPEISTMGDIVAELKTMMDSQPDTELRIPQICCGQINRVFAHHERIDHMFWTLHAEEIPEDEKTMGPNDRLIHVCHFTKEARTDLVRQV
eukprot:jgi/Chlat1/768/Chrsp104S00027